MTFSELASDSMYYFNLRYFHAWGYRPAMTIAVDLGLKANKQIHAWDIFISGNNHYITVIVVHTSGPWAIPHKLGYMSGTRTQDCV